MPGFFRTLVRIFYATAITLFSWSYIQAAASIDLTQKPTPPPMEIPAALVKDTSRIQDSLALADSLHADSLKSQLPDYNLKSPWGLIEECNSIVEVAADCWRRNPKLANMELGFPGTRGLTLSLTHWLPIPVHSPFFSAWQHSPYLNGGLAPMEHFVVQSSGGDVQAIEEIWKPVVPLDTPLTRLTWERGPLTLNVFDLRLRRMLGDRAYLALDYYSASADSQTYDYQFNVHQPYLGGLGIFGQIYKPMDRDSASLVLEGISPQMETVAFRPRIGFWLDTSRVLEVFFDRVKNATQVALPVGPKSFGGSSRPGLADSMQALVPTQMSSISEGLIYAESQGQVASQWEGSHTLFTVNEFNSPEGELQAQIFKLRGHWLGSGWAGKPFLTLETRSETWDGYVGWTDIQEGSLGVQPVLGSRRSDGEPLVNSKFDAGITRISRMDNHKKWLNHYGAEAAWSLPWGFNAEGGYASRMQDPDWETLYRTNPARFRYASPNLEPRTDRSFRGSLAWVKGRFFLDGGMDFLRRDEAWLPHVLPGPKACQDLLDTTYASMPAQRCSGVSTGIPETTGGLKGVLDHSGALPDSLALALRNFDSQGIDAWHLGLGFGLGHWDLQLRNRFVFRRQVKDAQLARSLVDLSVPERVFKGRLSWKRSLVDDKMKLNLSWDWEWFSTRYGWVPDQTGKSKVGKLDEYLALDFQAAMQIKTFTLFFRSKNMNHDRYATEPGVHPPGINFRFGVDWALTN